MGQHSSKLTATSSLTAASTVTTSVQPLTTQVVATTIQPAIVGSTFGTPVASISPTIPTASALSVVPVESSTQPFVSSIAISTTPTVLVSTSVSQPLPSSTSALADQQPSPVPTTVTQPRRGPTLPARAITGGTPTKSIDFPLSIVFLIAFATGSGLHLYFCVVGQKSGQKPVLSAIVSSFCIFRVITMALRLTWSLGIKNNSIAAAEIVLQDTGFIMLFAISTVLSRRVIKVARPVFAEKVLFKVVSTGMLVLVPVILLNNVIVGIAAFFVVGIKTLMLVIGIRVIGTAFAELLAFAPLPALLFPAINMKSLPLDQYDLITFQRHMGLLAATSSLLTASVAIRIAGLLIITTPSKPAPIDSKIIFYTAELGFELIVVVLYAITPVDLMFLTSNQDNAKMQEYRDSVVHLRHESSLSVANLYGKVYESQMDKIEAPPQRPGTIYSSSPEEQMNPNVTALTDLYKPRSRLFRSSSYYPQNPNDAQSSTQMLPSTSYMPTMGTPWDNEIPPVPQMPSDSRQGGGYGSSQMNEG